jgi:hypothetical protein
MVLLSMTAAHPTGHRGRIFSERKANRRPGSRTAVCGASESGHAIGGVGVALGILGHRAADERSAFSGHGGDTNNERSRRYRAVRACCRIGTTT